MQPRLDHVGLDVSDYAAGRAFYEAALAPLGIRLMMDPVPNVGGFGGDFPFFWIAERGRGPDSGTHVAFRVEDRATVDAFHAAALAGGGATTAVRASARSTTRPTTGRSCSTLTATTSRPSAMASPA